MCLFWALGVLPGFSAEFDPEIWDFFDRHCVECHDNVSMKGGLDLFQIEPEMASESQIHRWTQLYDRVANGEMPPEDRPRPEKEEISGLLDWIEPRLTKADRARREVVQRRLNRIEYENTVRYLLKVNVDVQELLPPDQEAGGFDNNGAALAVSAEAIERYLDAARRALDAAIVHGQAPPTQTFTVSSRGEVERYLGKQYGLEDGRIVIHLTDRGQYSKVSTRDKRLPEAGRYRFRFEAAAHNSDEPMVFSVMASDFERVGATYKNLGYYEVTSEPKVFEIEAELDEGFAIQFFAQGLPKWIKHPAQGGYPGIGFGEVEITGPLVDEWPPESHRSLLDDVDLTSGGLAEAETILRELMRRAFRRPVEESEVARYLDLVASRLKAGREFEASLRVGLEAVLCSPNFLYMRERGGEERISEHELASRLSYFFWSSMPDERLFDLVDTGKLSQPEILRAEVERLLDDPKSERFVANFTGQWLNLRDIEETTPDRKLYAEFDELLQVSMVREGEAFFRKLLEDDLSVTNFLDSDFAMLNQRLAEHYGIPDVSGLDMRAVALPPDSVRGGVLTQGGVLKVTANGTTTSPVIRGVWVLENILGKHIPPPPPNIAGIEPDIREATTIREQLDLHRDSDSCRTCHQHIDPPGFALESFDPIGGYRERYLQFRVNPEHADKGWGQVVEAKEVDASGRMPDGDSFESIQEFKALLLGDSENFTRCLTEKLLTYALGRELGFSDRPAVERIVQTVQAEGNGLRTLIHEIVQSEPFQAR